MPTCLSRVRGHRVLPQCVPAAPTPHLGDSISQAWESKMAEDKQQGTETKAGAQLQEFSSKDPKFRLATFFPMVLHH